MAPPVTESRLAEIVVAHPPMEIWRAFTHPDHLQYWAADTAEIDLRVGGTYNVNDTTGLDLRARIERLVEGRRLVLRPNCRGDDAFVEVDLVKLGRHETRVTVSHPDLDQLEIWHGALENLKSVWEIGVDLREARRGVMGVGLGEISAGDRPVPGVPDGTGVRLNAVMVGGPAEKAGLRRGDVIVGFEGAALHREADLVRRIQSTRPGTQVHVDVVRGEEQRHFPVTIGHRASRAEPPPSREEVVARLREAVSLAGIKLRKSVEGLPEGSAYKPESPSKWSVAQVLAHLSVTERMLQNWLDHSVRDGRPEIDDDACTSAPRLAAVLAGNPTVAELLERIRRDQEETATLLERVPDEVVRFKPRWARVVHMALEYHAHSDDHLSQIARIRSAIGA